MKRWLPAILAALAGIAILLGLLPKVHPAASWDYRLDRDRFVGRARALASAQGIDTTGWRVFLSAERRERLEDYDLRHPEDALACSLTPQIVRIVFASPGKPRVFSAELYPNGAVSGWEVREEVTDRDARYAPMGDAREAAQKAFLEIAGGQASSYTLTTDGAGTKRGSRFTWERQEREPGFHPTIDVIVHRGRVLQALTRLNFEEDVERRYAAARQPTDWEEIGFYVLIFVIVVAGAAFYILAAMQGRADHRFAVTYAIVNLCFVVLAALLGPVISQARTDEVLRNQAAVLTFAGLGFGWIAAAMLGVIVSGAGWFIAGTWRPKWRSLRQLLSRRALSRCVGRSILAGALWGPLLAAIPALVAWAFPGAVWHYLEPGQLVSQSLLVQAVAHPLHPLLVGLFGVLLAFLWNHIRIPWLRYLAIAACGVLYYSGYEGQFRNSLGANLAEAALMFAASFELFRRFDLLALLMASTAKPMLDIAAIGLLQPSPSYHWTASGLLLILSGVTAAGLLLLFKAPEADDPEEASARSLTAGIRSARDELKSEFTVAQRAQRQMLPENPPGIPGFTLATHCTPAKEVGGDLYDFLPFSDGRLGIAVADVSGKGVPAALYMTLTKGLLAATSQDALPIAAMLERINGHLYSVGRRRTFVTMALAILDPAGRRLEYARAGHNPAVWHSPSAGTTRLLDGHGLGLGITAGGVFGRTLAVETLDLSSGDIVVFYSDGLTEAMDAELIQFGEERLLELVAQSDGLSAYGVRDRILAAVSQFLGGQSPQDDLTLVVLRVE